MAVEIITSFQQICDSSGDPLSGGKVYVYNVGTTTARDIFSDTSLLVAAANPIILDSAGRADMRYTATGSYKIVVKSSADVTLYTRDNVDGRVPVGSGALAIANGGTGATTAGAALTALGGATAAELAAVAADVASLSGTLSSSEKTHIATGTTAQRPASPIQGDFRRNSTIPQWEGYSGTAWNALVEIIAGAASLPSASVALAALVDAAKPGIVLLTNGTVSGAATLDLVLTSYTGYRGLKIFLSGFRPATDDVELWMRLSTDGGSSYDGGVSDYSWSNVSGDMSSPGTGVVGNSSDNADSEIMLAGSPTATQSVGNATTEGVNMEITILNQTSTAFWPRVTYQGTWIDANATPIGFTVSGSGVRRAAQDTNAVRFLFESGNITEGNYAIYGLR